MGLQTSTRCEDKEKLVEMLFDKIAEAVQSIGAPFKCSGCSRELNVRWGNISEARDNKKFRFVCWGRYCGQTYLLKVDSDRRVVEVFSLTVTVVPF